MEIYILLDIDELPSKNWKIEDKLTSSLKVHVNELYNCFTWTFRAVVNLYFFNGGLSNFDNMYWSVNERFCFKNLVFVHSLMCFRTSKNYAISN